MIERKTILSDDRVYRYVLWRDWMDDVLELEEREGNNSAKYAMFIGLNPSTADSTNDDPTIRKCVGFAKRWGYGALCMCNLFACRARHPKDMRKAIDPVGDDNFYHISKCASEAGIIIAAWGNNGGFMKQNLNVSAGLASLRIKLKCLLKTDLGFPEHPLFVPYETQPIDFP